MKIKIISLLIILLCSSEFLYAGKKSDLVIKKHRIKKEEINGNLIKGNTISVLKESNLSHSYSLQKSNASLATPQVTADGPLTFCEGGKVTFTTAVIQGASYQWFNGGISIEGATTITYTAISSGVYTVKVTDAQKVSAESEAKEVFVNPAPVMPQLMVGGSAVLCEGERVKLSVQGSDAQPWYQWYRNGVAISKANASYYYATTTGRYHLQGTFGDCSSNSKPVDIKVNPLPSASITSNGPLEFCSGSSVILTGQGGTSYSWSNGTKEQSLLVKESGTYSVIVSDAQGCRASISAQVSVLPTPAAMLKVVDPLCAKASTGSIDLTITGGVTPYSHFWSNKAVTEDLNNLPAGTYSVTVRGANGCSSSSSVVLTDPAPLSAEAGKDTILYLGTGPLECAPLEMKNVSGGVMPYTYEWSSGANTATTTVCPEATTIYLGSVSDANGCRYTGSVTVKVIDIRCGNKNNKVSMCFAPPGNPSSSHQVCVSEHAVQDILEHTKSYLGTCSTSINGLNAGIPSELTIGPNPTSGSLKMSYQGSDKISSVFIYDRNGQLVKEINFSENNLFNLSVNMEDLQAGVYMISLKSSKGMKVKSATIIKQ